MAGSLKRKCMLLVGFRFHLLALEHLWCVRTFAAAAARFRTATMYPTQTNEATDPVRKSNATVTTMPTTTTATTLLLLLLL
jgi:hypothetical protein